MKKGLKITLIIIGSILAIIILATLLISPIAKKYVNSHGEELVGRKLHVDGLSVNVYTGHVAISDLKLYEDDGTTLFAGFDTLDVGVKLLHLLKSEVFVKHVTLAGLNVNVIQNGTKFNFTSMIDHFKSDEEDEDTTASNWKLNFHDIALRRSEIHYADLQRDSHWDINDLNLLVPDFCIGGEEATNGGLSLSLGEHGTLEAKLDYNANSNDFDLDLDLKQIALEQAKPYLTDVVNIGTLDGTLDAKLLAQGNLNKITELVVGGNIAVNGLAATDKQGTSLGRCSHIGVKINNIDLGTNTYDIASVNINQLQATYDSYKDHNTYSNVMKKAGQPTDTTATQPVQEDKKDKTSKPMKLTVGHFELTESAVTYADHTLADPFSFPVTHIHVAADNLKLQGENNALVEAALPNGGKANIRWNGNITNWKEKQVLFLKISNLKLTELSPYLVTYLGQPFTDGSFSFTSINRINHSELDGKNHVDIYKADVGKRRKDVDAELHLPLKAAIYILADKDDKIQLDVPISGNIDKPEFNYMKLVWKTLGNLLVKVATSPIRALGDLMGINSDNLEFIPVEPKQFDFTSEQYYRFDELAQMLEKEPMMTLTLEQQFKPGSDTLHHNQPQRLNEMLQKHFTEMGIPANRITVTTGTATDYTKNGYSITAAIKDDDTATPAEQ